MKGSVDRRLIIAIELELVVITEEMKNKTRLEIGKRN